MKDDLISRSALKEKSRRCFVDGFHGSGIYGEIEIVTIEDISLAPAVDAVEVVHGRWERSEPGYSICSHCKADVAIFSGHRNYCPNCGADMRERKDND